jgi:putative tryptophan/tyrosine transport system substrate-binding protein
VVMPEEIAGAIDAAHGSGAEALNVLASSLLYNNRQIVRARIAALRLPAIYQFPEVSEEDASSAMGRAWSRSMGRPSPARS